MNTTGSFTGSPTSLNRLWVVKCVGLAILVMASWVMKQLVAGCTAAIVIFALLEGILPLRNLRRDHDDDVRRCYEEKLALQSCGVELVERLPSLNTSEAGSLFKAIVAVSNSRRRMSKQEAIDRTMDVATQKWMGRLAPIESTAEQCLQLGFGGSLVGMGAAIENMASEGGEAGLYAAMSTMVLTTLVGLFFSILIKGLCSNIYQAIERHDAELRLFLGLLYGDTPSNQELKDDKRDDDADDTIFGGRP